MTPLSVPCHRSNQHYTYKAALRVGIPAHAMNTKGQLPLRFYGKYDPKKVVNKKQ